MYKKLFLILMIVPFVLVMLMTPYIYAEDTVYTWSSQSKKIDNSASLQTNASSTNSNTVTDNPLGITSGSACLMEQSTGNVIYDYNMHQQLRPASVTKVMSLLLIMEAVDSGRISLTDKVPCTEDAAKMGGSQIWLDVREELTVEEMIKAICVVSANDCVVAMADYLDGSQEAFVARMNEKAKELGMNDTCFKNCHGIDEDGHVTSAYDIALMSRELLTKHPSITKYTTIYMDTLRDGKSQLVNTNKLIKNYNGCTGLKTGSTSVALYNLSASATRNNLSLIGVIMKGPTSKVRFQEAQKLLDYGFSNYEYKEFGKQNDVIKSITVNKGVYPKVNAILENNSGVLLKRGESSKVTQNITMDDTIPAPIIKGQKLGEMSYSLNGETLATVNLVASKNVDKISLPAVMKSVYGSWFTLFRI